MTAKQIVEKWVDAFNNADVNTLENLYATNAINHQMPNEPVTGSKAIGQMFAREFATAPQMHCIPVQVIAEADWAVLEWKDPKGFCGCGFFMVQHDRIQVQRGYWDKLSFMKLYSTST